MISDKIKKIIEEEKGATFVNEIEYCNKTYVKTIKTLKNGIEYLYFEIDNDIIKSVDDEKLISYFKANYECNFGNIIFKTVGEWNGKNWEYRNKKIFNRFCI